MAKKGYKKLIVDKAFRHMVQPLRREEYRKLELELLMDGCRDAIVHWNGVIVEGHHRYEICVRLKIPYATQEIVFGCREKAVAWICGKQLEKTMLTEEMRKYLIGTQYEAERVLSCYQNASSFEANGFADCVATTRGNHRIGGYSMAIKIAQRHQISFASVQKYVKYSQALDQLEQKAPELVARILSGKYKVSHEKLMLLSTKNREEVKELNRQIAQKAESKRHIVDRAPVNSDNQSQETPAIKNMPAFDPDAEITCLTLTIPSWTSSIERAKSVANLKITSVSARNKLAEALEKLHSKAKDMLNVLEGDF